MAATTNPKVSVESHFRPTPQANQIIKGRSQVYNPADGIGMDILMKVIKKHVPTQSQGETIIRILHVNRYDGDRDLYPNKIDMQAYVWVVCEGLRSDETDRIQGMYHVKTIGSEDGLSSRFTIMKVQEWTEVDKGNVELVH